MQIYTYTTTSEDESRTIISDVAPNGLPERLSRLMARIQDERLSKEVLEFRIANREILLTSDTEAVVTFAVYAKTRNRASGVTQSMIEDDVVCLLAKRGNKWVIVA